MNTPSTVDILVVGAGPAGSGAALSLAEYPHLSVVVVDAHAFPRPKACGGAIPAAFLPRLGVDVSPAVKDRLRITELRAPRGTLSPLERAYGEETLIVDRAELDALLIDAAVRRASGGIRFRPQTRVRDLDVDANGVTVRVEGGKRSASAPAETIRARVVILADGAPSLARTLLPGTGRAASAAIELEVCPSYPVRRPARFDMSMGPSGYAWIFPKGETYACGAGGARELPRLRSAATEAMTRYFGGEDWTMMRTQGGPVPVFTGPLERYHSERVLVAGDAAHLVDPVLGEGIRYAFLSGQVAARTAKHALHRGWAGCGERYREGLGTEVLAELQKWRGLQAGLLRGDNRRFFALCSVLPTLLPARGAG